MFAELAAGWWDEVIQRSSIAIVVFFGTTVASFLIGRWWGRYLARRQWQRKLLLGRITVSLNIFTDGWLKIRTVFERGVEEVFINPLAVEKVQAASRRTTAEDPILPIPSEDRWFLLNFVLNAVAERFSDGAVRHDAGQPLTPVVYMLFLTCEVLGEDRIRKVRAMLIRKDVLEKLPEMTETPRLEQPWHADRIVTLRRAAELYRTEPTHFLPLEVYV